MVSTLQAGEWTYTKRPDQSLGPITDWYRMSIEVLDVGDELQVKATIRHEQSGRTQRMECTVPANGRGLGLYGMGRKIEIRNLSYQQLK